MAPPLTCEHCDRTFTKRYSLNRHLHSIHHMAPIRVPRKAILCPMRNCNDTFAYHGPLRSHLKSMHNIQLQGQKLTFASMKDFFEWKEKEEMGFFVKYVKACGVQRLLDNTEVYRFNCHRTGSYIPEGKGLRKLKSQGSCKIGASCPSTITAHRHPNDSVTCTYCLTHVGHDTTEAQASLFTEDDFPTPTPVSNLQVIKIICPTEFRNMIAANVPDSTDIVSIIPKLTSMLVQNQEVFKLFKLSEEDQVALSIILGQDRPADEMLESIRNIARKASVENFNELLSKVKAVKESAALRNMEVPSEMEKFLGKLLSNDAENPVLFYEHIALQTDKAVSELGRTNFIIMNSLQSLFLQTYGNNGVVCIDAVYGTLSAAQEYVILAIFVLNQCQGWTLCGLCMFAEMNEDSLTVIFTQIRNRTGVIVPNILLGDHQVCIYKAWERAMGKCGIYLVNSWHLDKVSQSLLTKSQADKTKLACTYKLLLSLPESENEHKFDELIHTVETAMPASGQNAELVEFLRCIYVENKIKCAKYHRQDLINKAANLMEPIHYLLEHICHDHGDNFSQALCLLLLFFRKHSFEGIDIREVEQTAFVDLSANEHQASLLLSKNSVSCLEEHQWSVVDGCQKYALEQEDCGCLYHCDTFCISCDVCLHSFKCSCINSVICWKICRHVHLLSKQLQGECWQDDLLDWNAGEKALTIVEHVTSPVKPESDILVQKVCRTEILADLQECSRKILANAELLDDIKDLEKLKDSVSNILNLTRSLIGPYEATKEQGIQCNMGIDGNLFTKLKSRSDHDYTSLC